MSRVFEIMRRRRDQQRERQQDGRFDVDNGDFSQWSHDLPRVKRAVASKMTIRDFSAWLDGDEVQPFFDEFELDYLGDATDYLPVTKFRSYNLALQDFKTRAEVSRRGLSHGLNCEDKTHWGMETHWAWFAFQVWWAAVHNNPAGSTWRRPDPELRYSTAKFLLLVIEYLQADWITNSTAARTNREEADRREGTGVCTSTRGGRGASTSTCRSLARQVHRFSLEMCWV
ncbi:hypothetical protein GE09DRAFT_293590 [Coniochaeta sp. 2T2.1]|nr:hypothetical protein GE09DRAFT_293590 [Coniochaeta sp. 2T2.1]